MLLKTLKRVCSGFVLGMAAGNLIAALTGQANIVSPSLLSRVESLSAALLWQTLLSGVIGVFGMGGTVLYEVDRWPLLAIDLAHYALYMSAFIPISLFLGWFEKPPELAVTAAIMFAAHFSIFLIMCAIYRSQVRELNRMQNQFLADQNTNTETQRGAV